MQLPKKHIIIAIIINYIYPENDTGRIYFVFICTFIVLIFLCWFYMWVPQMHRLFYEKITLPEEAAYYLHFL